ncbi:hypothetical protein KW807_00220 [Candidatus Parcubacteria bacterium]|nr:hypothetical protein [Candidatus Parcubacteria bacterium]
MERSSRWMAVSGATGFTFFLVANFTHVFAGSSIVAAILQLVVNAFVFTVWKKAFRTSSGFKKFVAFWGVIVPIVMATTTIWRVLLPFLF